MNKIKIDFKKSNGLVPVIVQDCMSKEILMLGYMNDLALDRTKTSGYVHFWSRSRNKLWLKGEKSGNKLKAIDIHTDCDCDALLIGAKLEGKFVCHTGSKSCFFNKIK